MKRKPLHTVRALALASLSSKLGSVFTVLASDELKVNKEEVATFGCKHCDTKFGAIASSEPFCITCGSEEVDLVEDEGLAEPEQVTDNAELSAITCKSCGTHNIVNSTVASTLNGKAHCITCGEGISFDPTSGDDQEELGDDEELDETDPLDDGVETSNDEGDSDEDDSDDIGGDVVSSDEDTMTYTVDATGEGVDVDLVDVADTGDDEEIELSMTLDNGVLVASMNGISVARLTKEQAGVNSDVYTKQSFADAVGVTASKVGVKAALKHYNFTLITATFPLSKIVDQRVEAALKEANTKVEATLNDLEADYTQCLQIASVGLGKNFFKGKDNALKAGLIQELTTAGVKNPGSLVDRVFANYGNAYLQTLLETAAELLNKSVDVRNQLAETLDVVNTVTDGSDNTDGELDGEAVGDEVVARLSGSQLRPENSNKKKAVTASAHSIRDVRSTLPGGKLF